MIKGCLYFCLAGAIALSGLAGCSSNKAASSTEAINLSKAMQTTQAKADYLTGQAKAFYNSKDFQGAVDIAQHLLQYVDKDSQAAKDLLVRAKEQLKAKAEQTLGDMKGAMGLGN